MDAPVFFIAGLLLGSNTERHGSTLPPEPDLPPLATE